MLCPAPTHRARTLRPSCGFQVLEMSAAHSFTKQGLREMVPYIALVTLVGSYSAVTLQAAAAVLKDSMPSSKVAPDQQQPTTKAGGPSKAALLWLLYDTTICALMISALLVDLQYSAGAAPLVGVER